nr:putative defensin-like protein 157 [Nicotiana tomentosiformis]
MKKFSSIVVFLFAICIVLGTKARGAKECRVPFPGAAKPCDPTDCNNQCFKQFQGKPAPNPSIKGSLLGGDCLAENCFCTFCCEVNCPDLHS